MCAKVNISTRPSWVPSTEIFIDRNEKTFQYDDLLPNLPLPALAHTLKIYLESVKPHVSLEEFQRTSKVVQQFEQNEGKELQKKLQEKFKDSRNWLENYWLEHTYLLKREPVVPFMYMIGLTFAETLNPPLGENKGFKYATLYIYYTMKFWKHVRKEEIRGLVSSRGTRYTMHQLKSLFNSNRLPGLRKDYIVNNFKTEVEGDASSHVVIVCHGHMYILETLDETEEVLSLPEIQNHLRYIWDDAHKRGRGPSLGALTAEKRVVWWQLRNHLKSLSPQNERYLKLIEEAAMVFTLEDFPNVDVAESCKHALIGNVNNQWREKGSSAIVWPNGVLISAADHTNMEGTANSIYSAYICAGAYTYMSEDWSDELPERQLHPPRQLNFVVDKKLQDAVSISCQNAHTMHESLSLRLQDINNIGKKLIKTWKIHPDALVQTAIQLAYYKLHRRPAPTYETATTRQYYRGRTETCRTCTTDLVKFCEVMLNEQSMRDEELSLLVTATQKHQELMGLCTKNHGCDRHLFGLKILAQEEGLPTPQIFLDSSWEKSGGNRNFKLSTSLAGYLPQRGGAPPMCRDGYGVYYSILDDSIKFMILTWRQSKITYIDEYSKSLDWALTSIYNLFNIESKL